MACAHCHAFAGAARLWTAVLVASACSRSALAQGRLRVNHTAAPPSVYPEDDAVGGIAGADARITMDVVNHGYDFVFGRLQQDALAVDLSDVTCADAGAMFAEIETEIERSKVTNQLEQFKAAEFNAKRADHLTKQSTQVAKSLRTTDVKDAKTAAANTFANYTDLHLRAVQVLEQFALKCGKVGKYCDWFHSFLGNEFTTLEEMRSKGEDLAFEAGWQAALAEKPGATEATQMTAKAKLHEAQVAMEASYTREAAFEAAMHVKSAACGPGYSSPWSVARDACSMPIENELMRAMMRERPSDFTTHWRQKIGHSAGIDPDLVRVEITACNQ